ncbi:MAG: FlgD immunoglobulin-like domain containing protein [Geothrix sp.]|nr:FlgD immunoglobulin-like domain containing protein [Geothrix sp.]
MQTGMISSTPTTATTSSGATTTSTNALSSLDSNSFLQLLVTQLQNQDPTSASAQDPTAMIQQLTSFSSLQQAQDTNTLLTGLQGQMSGLFQAQSTGMIGATAQVSGSQFNLSSGTASLNVNLNAAADVTLKVSNASGQVVATLPEGNLKAGSNTLTWNGKDANGNQLPDGTYNVSVSATDANGAAVANTTSMGVTVTGVGFQNGAVSIFSGSHTYSLSNVIEIDA